MPEDKPTSAPRASKVISTIDLTSISTRGLQSTRKIAPSKKPQYTPQTTFQPTLEPSLTHPPCTTESPLKSLPCTSESSVNFSSFQIEPCQSATSISTESYQTPPLSKTDETPLLPAGLPKTLHVYTTASSTATTSSSLIRSSPFSSCTSVTASPNYSKFETNIDESVVDDSVLCSDSLSSINDPDAENYTSPRLSRSSSSADSAAEYSFEDIDSALNDCVEGSCDDPAPATITPLAPATLSPKPPENGAPSGGDATIQEVTLVHSMVSQCTVVETV